MLNKKNSFPIIIISSLLFLAIFATILYAFFAVPQSELIADKSYELADNNVLENQDGLMNPENEMGGEIVVPEIGMILNLPVGWSVSQQLFDYQEKTLTLSNGILELSLTKDPIYTGGGLGFAFDGLQSEFGDGLFLESRKILFAGNEATFFVETFELEALKVVKAEPLAGDNENLPDGRYFSSAVLFKDEMMSQTGVNAGNNSYAVVFYPTSTPLYPGTDDEYLVPKYISPDSLEYLSSVNEIEEILASVIILQE